MTRESGDFLFGERVDQLDVKVTGGDLADCE
jgi:hypothetical protein